MWSWSRLRRRWRIHRHGRTCRTEDSGRFGRADIVKAKWGQPTSVEFPCRGTCFGVRRNPWRQQWERITGPMISDWGTNICVRRNAPRIRAAVIRWAWSQDNLPRQHAWRCQRHEQQRRQQSSFERNGQQQGSSQRTARAANDCRVAIHHASSKVVLVAHDHTSIAAVRKRLPLSRLFLSPKVARPLSSFDTNHIFKFPEALANSVTRTILRVYGWALVRCIANPSFGV